MKKLRSFFLVLIYMSAVPLGSMVVVWIAETEITEKIASKSLATGETSVIEIAERLGSYCYAQSNAGELCSLWHVLEIIRYLSVGTIAVALSVLLATILASRLARHYRFALLLNCAPVRE